MNNTTFVKIDLVHLETKTKVTSPPPGILRWETSVNGNVQDFGEIDMMTVQSRVLTTPIDARSFRID